jgi:hypothetical protein
MAQSYVESMRQPFPAPIEFAGKWVAWDKQRTKIVASGNSVAAVHSEAVAAGHPDALLQRVRRPEIRFIGAL